MWLSEPRNPNAPLAGLKVVELAHVLAGPFCGQILADLGADVIKVEQPGTGDPFRSFRGGLYAPHFQTYNRNKRSITIDPKKESDLSVLDRLVEDADVFIQNFRPGVAGRLNVDAARLRASTRASSMPRSRASAARGRSGIAPRSTPSPRPPAASCACSSTPNTRASSARRLPTP